MPSRPPSPCTQPMCTKYATKKGRCDEHQVKPWDHKGKSRQERGYGKAWERLRRSALSRDAYMCQACKEAGVYTEAKEVDHIKPKYMGGKDVLSNCLSLCIPCHRAKTLQESIDARRP